MTESSNLTLKARDLLVSPSHEGLAIVVNQLFIRQESEECKTARELFDFCISYYSNCLTQKLLKVYQSSSNGVTRFRSIYLLSEILSCFRIVNFKFSLDSLYEIKPLLIECLVMQETKESDIKIFRRIVYFIAHNVLFLHNGKWDELGDCILSLGNSEEPRKAFHIFIDLPPVYKDFIEKIFVTILERVDNVFHDLESVEDWSLALQTLVKMWIQLLNTDVNTDALSSLMENKRSIVVNSVIELVFKEKEKFLLRGLEDFERFFSREMSMYQYSEDQCHFVLASMNEIEEVVGIGTKVKEIVRKIKMLVTEPKRYDLESCRDEFDSGWYDHLKSLSSLEVLKIFASTELEDRSREIAIRRLNVLLSNHTSKKVTIDIAEMRQLQPLLMSCLKEEGLSDSMFKVLGEVVNHVAYELLVYQQETCYELRDYIVSGTTEFQRAVYIFQCLTMEFSDGDFVMPVIEKLLPEISTRLDPPTELLVDNSYWVLVFTGAFCVAIHLTENSSQAEAVEEIAEMMIDCVRELVERGMEVGLVRRAFRDVERIVKKQLEWYSTSEYKFLKGLLWKLYAIKGMKWETKIVLWRINVIVERGVKETEKELPKDEFLNLTDEKVE